MEKTNERKVYCAPQCTWLELAEDELMRGTSFENPGSGGSGHASAGDSGGLSAKSNPFFEEEDENEETGWE